MTMRRLAVLWVLLMALAPFARAATVQAFLDRNHVTLGDTVTLNIQSSDPLGNPDLSPLQKDFDVLGTSRSRSVQIVNGKATSTEQLGIALKPRHTGTLEIPPIAVGGDETAPLTLQVGAAPSGGTGKVGDPVFMEANVQSSSPWVGQQTVYTVRLFYLPGVDGGLSGPTADGARLIQLDRDHRYVTQRDGYTYEVIERSWALIPQRSGEISVQGPVFQGQRTGPGFPNAWFNSPNSLLNNPNALLNAPPHGFGGMVRATAPVARIDARAPPPGAGKPWLPARSLELKLSGLPGNGEVDAGTPLTVTLSIRASGQSADALPEPELPPIQGARVYPDQTRDSTDDGGKWLQGARTRSFAIVPEQNGKLTIPAITLNWWNVVQNRAEQARVPAHTLEVSGVVAASPAPAAPPTTVPSSTAAPVAAAPTSAPPAPAESPNGGWRDIALASFALWGLLVLAAIAWLWSRRHRSAAVPAAGGTEADGPDRSPEPASTAANVQRRAASPDPRADRKRLQQDALAAARAGDAANCERAVLAWARASRSGIVNSSALRDALADPAQRAALDELQQARWRGADGAAACATVLQAFARGFEWRDAGPPHRHRDALPPLYPSS